MAHSQASSEGRDWVLRRLPKRERCTYLLADRASQIGLLIFILSIVFAPLWLAATSWQTGGLGLLVLSVLTFLFNRHAKPVNSQIHTQTARIFGSKLKKAIEERREDERFYQTTEWKTLRFRFLRSKRKTAGRYICNYCQSTIFRNDDITVDHVKPRSKFRELALDLSNLRIACRRCNSSKGDKIVSDN